MKFVEQFEFNYCYRGMNVFIFGEKFSYIFIIIEEYD